MSNDAGTISLPLLTLGLPGYVSGWLLDAGISIAPLDTAGVRRGIAAARIERSIVLYDSRSASARTDAEAAEALGYETIDAARLMTGRLPEEELDQAVIPSTDPRRRFFETLRPAVEAAGGLWLRLADFPHPFRWAVCGEVDGLGNASDSQLDSAFATALSAFAELPAANGAAGRLSAADWLKTCASIGRPVRMAGDAATVLARHGLSHHGPPLVWIGGLSSFADWWRFRRQIGVRAVRRGRACEVEVLVTPGASKLALPALEIWRGRHLAVVPLKPGRMVFQDDTLPFQMNTARHSAGFTADAAETEFATSRDPSALVAPA